MILSDKDIKTKFESGEIKISPMPDLNVALGPMSIDLRLGHQFMVFKRTEQPYIDVQQPDTFQNLTSLINKQNHEPFTIHPGEFMLATTLESVEIPNNLAGRLEGRSSLGRLGIVIHSTAGKFDPGWKGNLVLEISNIGLVPVRVYPEMRVCQLLFEELSSETAQPYTKRESSKYKFQHDPVGSKITSDNNEG
ncbi:MAG: dCTP deaminase [Candidatus Doudnabacteria bacterium RIFCSPHIGHO2_02_FULL_48_21]|uniref:dCTP deaminase n=1 Tax=Candidatus Doudnabacteria bacterium RIFCSPLOWO2_02_FULL_48_13 TaxID=1817845 RepID=A0A1F5QAE1_9BACT|nr:MAG: dCTP deaminase [Candidatus Doudnabacteria bacterium RIFCSPHIGHO2_01_48_18]OGE78868.1 MAG: dCTP deaminase [Candidatus Doudnabacteria bacterium RIFCSPHIGHO2_01_FULL_48_180]OGE91859.1 MAG: dCTP deaminase [Candidatus Doudnabacteria bacterium RIFCSPHIGHO2_12_FULL_47_25]OGE94096.1 MAG: dCTP deaminase [Candidatus Doudnabacteria bacterium RIFCSPHIGHO2_02_FULL_48_21]OGE98198.1 MAG: dCTP deaminase [Candidatus Doudnabacteria bacterium RIFCSPLOWO2_01_FULL_48_57]OGE99097.1 MAG: dCTP deaminase [Cand